MSDNDREQARDKSRKSARNFGAIVYVGGVVAATVLFITFALTAFPPEAYLSRVIMTLAGIAVGSSMVAFPVAMHNWIVTKDHRFWGAILYYGEMLIIAINTVVAFITLLSKYSNAVAPAWALKYEPYSVASVVYTVFAWGTLFLLDPEHKEFAEEKDEDTTLRREVAKLRVESLKKDKQRIQAMADAEIDQRYTVANYLKSKGLDNGALPVSGTPFEKKQFIAPPVPEPVYHPVSKNHYEPPAPLCAECGKPISSGFFCDSACSDKYSRRAYPSQYAAPTPYVPPAPEVPLVRFVFTPDRDGMAGRFVVRQGIEYQFMDNDRLYANGHDLGMFSDEDYQAFKRGDIRPLPNGYS